jgi:hypothetical protein
MAANCWPVLMSALLGAGPAAVMPAPQPNVVETTVAQAEARYCFDGQAPWLHGYTQEIPAYSGFHSFRPYNYKHVLNQSQIVGGWGLSPASPYSQQYWHRPAQ